MALMALVINQASKHLIRTFNIAVTIIDECLRYTFNTRTNLRILTYHTV